MIEGKGQLIDESNQRFPKDRHDSEDIAFADFDGDLDLLCGNRFNGMSMMVLINDGQARFSDKTTDFLPAMNVYPFDFQVADFNKDGKKDLYLCEFRG